MGRVVAYVHKRKVERVSPSPSPNSPRGPLSAISGATASGRSRYSRNSTHRDLPRISKKNRDNGAILGLLLWFGIAVLTIVFVGVILLIVFTSNSAAIDRLSVAIADRTGIE